MKTKITAACLTGLLATALLTGCTHKNTLAGTWHGTSAMPQGATMQTTITFTQDGRETMAALMSDGRQSLNVAGSGTYTLSGSSLTQTYNTLSVNGHTIPSAPGKTNSETDQYTLDGDTLTLTKGSSAAQMVLTRQKS